MSSIPPKRYYVYFLCDPRDDIFYIGKGSGNRIYSHEKEAARGCACPKCCEIREIQRMGGDVLRYVVLETDNEREAFICEADLIESIGLKGLCNITPGARGARYRPIDICEDARRELEEQEAWEAARRLREIQRENELIEQTYQKRCEEYAQQKADQRYIQELQRKLAQAKSEGRLLTPDDFK